MTHSLISMNLTVSKTTWIVIQNQQLASVFSNACFLVILAREKEMVTHPLQFRFKMVFWIAQQQIWGAGTKVKIILLNWAKRAIAGRLKTQWSTILTHFNLLKRWNSRHYKENHHLVGKTQWKKSKNQRNSSTF